MILRGTESASVDLADLELVQHCWPECRVQHVFKNASFFPDAFPLLSFFFTLVSSTWKKSNPAGVKLSCLLQKYKSL